jgi:hypothetical protein
VTDDATTRVHDKPFRCEQCFNLFEKQDSFLAIRNQARCRRLKDEGRDFNLCNQCGDAGVARGGLGSSERSARRFRAQTPYRDPRNHQGMRGPRRGRKKRGIEIGEHAVDSTSETRLDRLTALVGIGYFFVWTAFGMGVFPLGVALADIEMRQPALARAIPIVAGAVVLIAGLLQFTAWKAHHLATCRKALGCSDT